jgi:two-component system chemotaxis response regulator CheB
MNSRPDPADGKKQAAAASGVARRPLASGGRIVFVGASTGGTEAVKNFLLGIPADCAPILIVQHMPETFTAAFAARLNGLCRPRVIEAQGGETLESGTVYVAPGHSHLTIKRSAAGYATELSQAPPFNRHRPSVDVLFNSAAEIVGSNAIGVILTGMGKDGARGLLHMRNAGARTFGQDEASCVVYGMPREAALIGAIEEVAGLDDLARRVLHALGRKST